jgi:hypothetical protein
MCLRAPFDADYTWNARIEALVATLIVDPASVCSGSKPSRFSFHCQATWQVKQEVYKPVQIVMSLYYYVRLKVIKVAFLVSNEPESHS